MNEKLLYWASVLFGAVALVLLVVNVTLSNSNRLKQVDVSQRQATISGGQSLSQFNQNLVQAMADAAIKGNDPQMRELLASQGITLKSDTSSAADKPVEKKTAEKAPEKIEKK